MRNLCILFVLCASTAFASPTSTTPLQAGEWLFTAGCIMGLILLLLQIKDRVSPTRKPPLEAEFMARADLSEHCRKEHAAGAAIATHISQRQEELERKHAEIAKAAADSDRRVHERLDRLVPIIYRIAGKLEVPTGDAP